MKSTKQWPVLLVAGALVWGLALPPVQALEQEASVKRAPANVVYTFNKVKPNGIVRDVTPPKHLRMQLNGNWRVTKGVNGKKQAVALQARSRGIINRSESLIPKRRAFAVAMTVKLKKFVGDDTPNLAQLGFYRDAGQWKVEALPSNGRVQFRVKGKSGVSRVTSGPRIDDGEYHLVVVYRKKGKVGVIVDGQTRTRKDKSGVSAALARSPLATSTPRLLTTNSAAATTTFRLRWDAKQSRA